MIYSYLGVGYYIISFRIWVYVINVVIIWRCIFNLCEFVGGECYSYSYLLLIKIILSFVWVIYWLILIKLINVEVVFVFWNVNICLDVDDKVFIWSLIMFFKMFYGCNLL